MKPDFIMFFPLFTTHPPLATILLSHHHPNVWKPSWLSPKTKALDSWRQLYHWTYILFHHSRGTFTEEPFGLSFPPFSNSISFSWSNTENSPKETGEVHIRVFITVTRPSLFFGKGLNCANLMPVVTKPTASR